jgi:hypothetical protein
MHTSWTHSVKKFPWKLNIVTGSHLKCRVVLYSGEHIIHHLNDTPWLQTFSSTIPFFQWLMQCLLFTFAKKFSLYSKPRGHTIRNGSFLRYRIISVSLQCYWVWPDRNLTQQTIFGTHKVESSHARKSCHWSMRQIIGVKKSHQGLLCADTFYSGFPNLMVLCWLCPNLTHFTYRSCNSNLI